MVCSVIEHGTRTYRTIYGQLPTITEIDIMTISNVAKLHEQPAEVETSDADGELAELHDLIYTLSRVLDKQLQANGPCDTTIYLSFRIEQLKKKCWYYWIKTTEGQAYIQKVRDLADANDG